LEKHRYEQMLPHEIVVRRQRFPAAFIGLGGLEWHGEHLLRPIPSREPSLGDLPHGLRGNGKDTKT